MRKIRKNYQKKNDTSVNKLTKNDINDYFRTPCMIFDQYSKPNFKTNSIDTDIGTHYFGKVHI